MERPQGIRTMSDKKKRIDIHEYLAEFEDIPGTRVFTAKRARQGYHLNQFAMSLMKAENRERFLADEKAYLDEWKLSEEAKQAVMNRDYNAMIDCGGNIYFLSKLFSTDKKSFQFAAGSMTGMSQEEYAEMMLKGGRSPQGQRSIKEGRRPWPALPLASPPATFRRSAPRSRPAQPATITGAPSSRAMSRSRNGSASPGTCPTWWSWCTTTTLPRST